MTFSKPIEPCLTKADKEKYLKQRALTIWLTGLSGSGKSTLALGLEKMMASKGYFTRVLDGDIIRTGINSDLGFTTDQRLENIRRIAEINKLFNQTGIITINAFISPTQEIREMARRIIGPESFIEVFVEASLDECIRRDPKGLYKKVKEGKIKDFTGFDAPFEPPLQPDLVIHTEKLTEEKSIDLLFQFIFPKVAYSK
jgi:adenylylsulfate kinase